MRSFWLYGALCVAIQGLSGCGSNAVVETKTEVTNTTKVAQYDWLVVAFGDSLYAGYRLAPGDGLAPQLQALDENDPAAREVRKLVGEHLPEPINGYKKIPDSLKNNEYAGKTPVQQLVDGLKTIDREIETMTGQISRGELDKLAVRGRYLETRYDDPDANGRVV